MAISCLTNGVLLLLEFTVVSWTSQTMTTPTSTIAGARRSERLSRIIFVPKRSNTAASVNGRHGIVAPYVSIWAIESVGRPEWIGWWAICGDLPTDYISSADVRPPQHPRKALRVIAEQWLKYVKSWNDGRGYENFRIRGDYAPKELAQLLETRADLLIKWADDDSLWEEE